MSLWNLEIGHWKFTRACARVLLPSLLVLTPTLLMLDAVEPGFVRSVVNPYAFVTALVIVGVIAGPAASLRAPSKRMSACLALTAACIAGLWVWWDLRAGTLGLIIATLAAVSVGATVVAMHEESA